MLANRTVLFIGFGLGDYDLLMLIKYLKNTLGKHMPKSFAVMRNENNYLEKFWKEYDITIINEDATLFLTELENTVKKLKFQLQDDLEPWMKNSFFMELLEIRGLPTETQVIEALLKEIKHKIEDGIEDDILKEQINDAINLVLKYRKNYHALGNLLIEINKIFETCKESQCPFWSEFSKLENHRKDISFKLNSKCTEVIGQAKNILLFSQSQRVTNLLNSLPGFEQEKIQLYIGECRPKSPTSFQDAILTAKLLKNTKYKIRLVTDMAIFHLLEKKSIDLILMGAHGVYKTEENTYKYFVNTCGSSSIASIAESNNIPLKLIFEKEKEEIYVNESSLDNISYDEEENIVNAAISEIAKDRDLSEKIRIINIGYDLVKWSDNIIPVTNIDTC
jgi:translation initiation factor 2B subunit (eIF-2B alpha/beta/delta family)